jgi:hypothetical protein
MRQPTKLTYSIYNSKISTRALMKSCQGEGVSSYKVRSSTQTRSRYRCLHCRCDYEEHQHGCGCHKPQPVSSCRSTFEDKPPTNNKLDDNSKTNSYRRDMGTSIGEPTFSNQLNSTNKSASNTKAIFNNKECYTTCNTGCSHRSCHAVLLMLATRSLRAQVRELLPV